MLISCQNIIILIHIYIYIYIYNSLLNYRDRAKERRLKYGESDPPPPNRSKERFEKEVKSVSRAAQPNVSALPIGENNVGNRLLQKKGWSEGQGLGRTNQGRTNIQVYNGKRRI